MLTKVISGGQTGVDRLGLDAAKEAGIETGGMAPRNYRTERGSDLSLKDYGLTESISYGYTIRTRYNAIISDGTVLFGNLSSPGSLQTIQVCKKFNKPYLENPTCQQLVDWIQENRIYTLNVAGNRSSNLTVERMEDIYSTLRNAFLSLKK